MHITDVICRSAVLIFLFCRQFYRIVNFTCPAVSSVTARMHLYYCSLHGRLAVPHRSNVEHILDLPSVPLNSVRYHLDVFGLLLSCNSNDSQHNVAGVKGARCGTATGSDVCCNDKYGPGSSGLACCGLKNLCYQV